METKPSRSRSQTSFPHLVLVLNTEGRSRENIWVGVSVANESRSASLSDECISILDFFTARLLRPTHSHSNKGKAACFRSCADKFLGSFCHNKHLLCRSAGNRTELFQLRARPSRQLLSAPLASRSSSPFSSSATSEKATGQERC